MDYSNTNFTGKQLLNKNIKMEAIRFKIKYIKENMTKLRLIDEKGKHEKFINNIEELINRNINLTEAQIKYLDGLFDEIL